jgi:hypothetical protein
MKIKPSEIKGGHHFALTKKADEGGCTPMLSEMGGDRHQPLECAAVSFGLPVVPAFYRDLRTVRDRARNVRHNDEPPTQTIWPCSHCLEPCVSLAKRVTPFNQSITRIHQQQTLIS